MIDRRHALGLLSLAALTPWAASARAAGPHPAITLWSTLEAARQDIPAETAAAEIDDALVEAVTARLTLGGKALTLAFATGLKEALGRANRWDLWGAGHVIHGGMSDDGFLYFRAWLIGQGRAVFDQALADPDSLAELIPVGREDALDLELLLYCASEAWGNLHQETIEVPAFPELGEPDGDPAGQAFDEETVDQAYPRLTARFGETPLT